MTGEYKMYTKKMDFDFDESNLMLQKIKPKAEWQKMNNRITFSVKGGQGFEFGANDEDFEQITRAYKDKTLREEAERFNSVSTSDYNRLVAQE